MRVSKNSSSGNIAGVVAGALREGDKATLEGIGQEVNYICVKAIALSNDFLKHDGIDQFVRIRTTTKMFDEKEVTAYVYEIEGRKRP